MPDVSDAFEDAAERVQSLETRPDNDTLLKLYALYKQATEGDVSGKRPGFTQLAARMKYDAWAGLEGTSSDDAQADYIALVDRLTA